MSQLILDMFWDSILTQLLSILTNKFDNLAVAEPYELCKTCNWFKIIQVAEYKRGLCGVP